MSERVWKCEYCMKTNKSFDVINMHERKCSHNPRNKTCYTCVNYESDGFWVFGQIFSCSKGLEVDYFEDKGNCGKWRESEFI